MFTIRFLFTLTHFKGNHSSVKQGKSQFYWLVSIDLVWSSGVVVITTAQLHSTKLELEDSGWRWSLTRVPIENKVKCLSLVNIITFIIIVINDSQEKELLNYLGFSEIFKLRYLFLLCARKLGKNNWKCHFHIFCWNKLIVILRSLVWLFPTNFARV